MMKIFTDRDFARLERILKFIGTVPKHYSMSRSSLCELDMYTPMQFVGWTLVESTIPDPAIMDYAKRRSGIVWRWTASFDLHFYLYRFDHAQRAMVYPHHLEDRQNRAIILIKPL